LNATSYVNRLKATCYFLSVGYRSETNNCAAAFIANSSTQTVVFIQNYTAITGSRLPSQTLIAVGTTCANVLFSSGDVAVVTKARNTAVHFNGMTLTEGNASADSTGQGCSVSACLMMLNANHTGALVYNFTLDEQPEHLYLRLSESALINNDSTVSISVSPDGSRWKKLVLEDLHPVAYDTQDITGQIGTSHTVYVRADFDGITFQQLVQLIGAGETELPVELVGCR